MDSNKDYMNMSLDQIIEKRRSQSLKNGRRNEKIRNRTAIRKKSDLMIQTKANPAICVRMNGAYKWLREDGIRMNGIVPFLIRREWTIVRAPSVDHEIWMPIGVTTCIQITGITVPAQLRLLKPVILLLVNSSSHRCVEPSPAQTTFEVGRMWR